LPASIFLLVKLSSATTQRRALKRPVENRLGVDLLGFSIDGRPPILMS
jgi:hypothetical protein